jgi:hypothetical protein
LKATLTGLSGGSEKGGRRGCTVEPMENKEERGEKGLGYKLPEAVLRIRDIH